MAIKRVYSFFVIAATMGAFLIPVSLITWIWIDGMWKATLAGFFIWIVFGFSSIIKEDEMIEREKPKSGFQERLEAVLTEQQRIQLEKKRRAEEN